MGVRSRRLLALSLFAGALLALPPWASAQAARSKRTARARSAGGVAVAKLVWMDQDIEGQALAGGAWRRLREGEAVRTGDRVRTAPEGVARLEFPWMTVTLGPEATLSVPASVVLSTVLEQGRAEFAGAGRDIVKIEVAQAEIRGGGRLVVRREAGLTSATALEGSFRIAAEGRYVKIQAGEGTVVVDGKPPAFPAALPPAPKGLHPSRDPVYVRSGKPVELRWERAGNTYHVAVLALRSEDVLLVRDAGRPPLRLVIPWLGTYRWRVSARDGHGLESRPSADGLLCVVER
ncbi:MAG: hypothetical protein A2V74_07115 [Acidobacteria bacterium RBG_16_70_10]|nr:MAG: hypothetical protein A2V74_07115 [Acidobacteria bacterium RBG_16_70_10]